MIKMAIDGPLEYYRSDLRIEDRYVAALIFSLEGNVLTMWDWKSGECVLVSSLPYILFITLTTHLIHTQFCHQHELGVWSYTFLDACTLLLVVEKGGRIAFKTSSPGWLSGTNSRSKRKPKPKYLMFPDVPIRSSMIFYDGKLPQPESYSPTSMSFSRPTVPAQADHGVVALSITAFHYPPVRYLVFFLREVLARLFRQEQKCSLEREGEWEYAYVVDWADWGPEVSRWFFAPSTPLWHCLVHGYRFGTLVTRLEASIISPSFTHADIDITTGTKGPPPDAGADEDEDADADAPLYLLVFDFNPYPLRRHQSSPPPPTENSPSDNGTGNTVVIAPSDVTFHDREEVIGRLGCRVTLMDKPADYAALAVCEDNIIGFRVRPNQHTHRERFFLKPLN